MEFIGEAWQRLIGSDTLIATVITVVSPLVLLAFNKIFSQKAKLRYGTTTDLVLLPVKADGSPGVLKIRQIRVVNSGNKAADDVEIILNWKPMHIEQYPHLATGEEIKPDGRYIVRLMRLNAKEFFDISMVSDGGDLPSVIYLRAKDTTSKIIQFKNLVWYPIHIRTLIFTLLIFGFFTLTYLFVILGGWIFFGRPPSV